MQNHTDDFNQIPVEIDSKPFILQMAHTLFLAHRTFVLTIYLQFDFTRRDRKTDCGT